MMKKCRGCGFLSALLFAAPLFAQTTAWSDLTQAQINARAQAQDVPEIPFESVPNFLKFPANLYMGEGIGVATNSKGHVFVYTRSQQSRQAHQGVWHGQCNRLPQPEPTVCR
jgi:hypothetical protein